MVERCRTQDALARALDISPAYVRKLMKSGVIVELEGEPGVFDLDAARRALAARRRGDAPTAAVPPAPSPADGPRFALPPPVSPNELVASRSSTGSPLAPIATAELVASARDREILSASQDPIERIRAAARVASRDLAASIATDMPMAVRAELLDSLKRTHDGLRLGEADALELQKAREEVVDRDILRWLGGELGRRMKSAFERLDVRLAARVEEWLGDERFLALEPRERASEVRKWTRTITQDARTLEANEVDRLVVTELAERKED